MKESRQEVFEELAKLRSLPPLGKCTSEIFKNLDVLLEEINMFQWNMYELKGALQRDEEPTTTMTELYMERSVTRTIISEFSKVSGLVSVKTLRNWRLMIEDWRHCIRRSHNLLLYPEMELSSRGIPYGKRIQMEVSFMYFEREGIDALRERRDLYQLTDTELRYMGMEQEIDHILKRGQYITCHVDFEELDASELRTIFHYQIPTIDQVVLRSQEVIKEYIGWDQCNPGVIEDWDLRLEGLEEFKVEVVRRFALSGSCDNTESSPLALALVSVFQQSSSKSILDIVEEFEASTRLLSSGDGKAAMFIDHCLGPDIGAQFTQFRQLPFKSLKCAVINRFGGIFDLFHKELSNALHDAAGCTTKLTKAGVYQNMFRRLEGLMENPLLETQQPKKYILSKNSVHKIQTLVGQEFVASMMNRLYICEELMIDPMRMYNLLRTLVDQIVVAEQLLEDDTAGGDKKPERIQHGGVYDAVGTCPIHAHLNHPVYNCKKLMQLMSSERLKLISIHFCQECLLHHNKCTKDGVHSGEELLCSECSSMGIRRDVLICSDSNHTKMTGEEYVTISAKYRDDQDKSRSMMNAINHALETQPQISQSVTAANVTMVDEPGAGAGAAGVAAAAAAAAGPGANATDEIIDCHTGQLSKDDQNNSKSIINGNNYALKTRHQMSQKDAPISVAVDNESNCGTIAEEIECHTAKLMENGLARGNQELRQNRQGAVKTAVGICPLYAHLRHSVGERNPKQFGSVFSRGYSSEDKTSVWRFGESNEMYLQERITLNLDCFFGVKKDRKTVYQETVKGRKELHKRNTISHLEEEEGENVYCNSELKLVYTRLCCACLLPRSMCPDSGAHCEPGWRWLEAEQTQLVENDSVGRGEELERHQSETTGVTVGSCPLHVHLHCSVYNCRKVLQSGAGRQSEFTHMKVSQKCLLHHNVYTNDGLHAEPKNGEELACIKCKRLEHLSNCGCHIVVAQKLENLTADYRQLDVILGNKEAVYKDVGCNSGSWRFGSNEWLPEIMIGNHIGEVPVTEPRTRISQNPGKETSVLCDCAWVLRLSLERILQDSIKGVPCSPCSCAGSNVAHGKDESLLKEPHISRCQVSSRESEPVVHDGQARGLSRNRGWVKVCTQICMIRDQISHNSGSEMHLVAGVYKGLLCNQDLVKYQDINTLVCTDTVHSAAPSRSCSNESVANQSSQVISEAMRQVVDCSMEVNSRRSLGGCAARVPAIGEEYAVVIEQKADGVMGDSATYTHIMNHVGNLLKEPKVNLSQAGHMIMEHPQTRGRWLQLWSREHTPSPKNYSKKRLVTPHHGISVVAGGQVPLTLKLVMDVEPKKVLFLLQTMKVKNHEGLVFSDSCILCNLISRVLAEKIRLKPTSSTKIMSSAIDEDKTVFRYEQFKLRVDPLSNATCYIIHANELAILTSHFDHCLIDETPRENADIFTKGKENLIGVLQPGSRWFCAQDWVREDSFQCQHTFYQHLRLEAKDQMDVMDEIHKEPVLLEGEHCAFCNRFDPEFLAIGCSGSNGGAQHCKDCICLNADVELSQGVELLSFNCITQEMDVTKIQNLLLNPVYHGWNQFKRVMDREIFFCKLLKHKALHNSHEKCVLDCSICRIKNPSNIDGFSPAWESVRDYEVLVQCAKHEAILMEEKIKLKKLSKCTKIDGVYYEISRFAGGAILVQKDLPFDVFFDKMKISSAVPAFLEEALVAQAIVLQSHIDTASLTGRCGVEGTYANVSGVISVIGNLCAMAQQVRNSCSLCRLLAKRVLEKRMGKHPNEFTGPQNMLQNNERASKAWYTLYMKSIHQLMPQVSKFGKTESVVVGDVVVFVTVEENLAGSGWTLGRVSKIVSSNSIEVKYSVVDTRSDEINHKVVMQSPRQCSRIVGTNECRTNTSDVFQTIL